MVRLLADAGGPAELERGLVVVGEHVGEVFCPLARLLFDPGGGCLVAGCAGGTGDLAVADVPHEHGQKPYACSPSIHLVRAGRTSSFRPGSSHASSTPPRAR